ncbi:Neurolysin [Manis pentadactyla]|nr:Neurolysin [Manis pentadactyla]
MAPVPGAVLNSKEFLVAISIKKNQDKGQNFDGCLLTSDLYSFHDEKREVKCQRQYLVFEDLKEFVHESFGTQTQLIRDLHEENTNGSNCRYLVDELGSDYISKAVCGTQQEERTLILMLEKSLREQMI